MEKLETIKTIVEVTDYSFRFWAVIAVFYGLRDGFVLQDEHGDRRVLYDEEVNFYAKRCEGYKYYALTGMMAEAIERGFDKWQEKK